MSKKLKKVRIYQEPDYTASSGYLLADAGEGQSTGKITFADLGNLIRSNPELIVFQKDQGGNIVPYRQLTFEQGVQPQYEQIDFKWINDNVYKLIGGPAIITWSEYPGLPIFFMAGQYNDPQTNFPYFEFTRFDTTYDQLVTEHSILVATDGSYPFDTGNTICSERKVTIDSQQIQFIVSNSTASAGPSVYQKCETYAANTAEWKRVHPLVFVDTGYSLQYNQYYNYAGKYNNYHQFYRVTPASLGSPGSTINVEIDTLRVSSSTIWHASANIATQEWVSNNYVVKVTGKGLSTNDYTAADKAVVDLAYSAIPSSASSSNMLMTRTDVETIVSKIGGYKKVPLDTSGYPDVQDPSVKLIYLTPASDASAANYYDEWLYDSASPVNWEKIGNTQIDLDGYATEDYVDSHTSAYITSAYLGPYAKIIDVQTSIDQATSGKMDKSQSADFYPMATNPSGYLIAQDLNGYATETYVQNYTSAFITSADVPSGVQYSAGENIDISGNVISVTDKSQLLPGQNIAITPSGNDFVISSTGGTIVYSAGRYVDIDNFVINVTGLQPSGSYLTSADLNGYATEQYVTDHTSAFITSAYLNDYAKTSALNDLSDTLTDFTDEFTADLDDLTDDINYVSANIYDAKLKLQLGYGAATDTGFTANAASDATVIIPEMTGATSAANGTAGLVPAPAAGDENKVLKGDGTWGEAGSSVRVSYDAVNEELHLDFSNGGN